MYHDIDNPLKPILDALGKIIEDDRYILELNVKKTPQKKGAKGSIKVYVGSLAEKSSEVKRNSETKVPSS